jgi:hypothetical protein
MQVKQLSRACMNPYKFCLALVLGMFAATGRREKATEIVAQQSIEHCHPP